MQLEIRRISPVRTANVVAVFYFIFCLVFSLIMFAASGLGPTNPNLDPAQQASAQRMFRVLMFAYPLLGLVFGWIFTVVAAFIYNTLTPRMGGVVLEVSDSRALESGAGA